MRLRSRDRQSDGYYGAINGVLAHECGHLFFGFFDVYDVASGFPTVGFWSLMDYGNGVGSIILLPDQTELFAVGLLPPSIDPWHKFRFMLEDEVPFPELAYGDTMSSGHRALSRSAQGVALDRRYLLIENRYWHPRTRCVSIRLDHARGARAESPIVFEYDACCRAGGCWCARGRERLPNEFVEPCDSHSRQSRLRAQLELPPARIVHHRGGALDDLGDPGPVPARVPHRSLLPKEHPSLSTPRRRT